MADIIKIGIMGAIRGTSFARDMKLMKDVEFTAVCETDESAMEKMREHLWAFVAFVKQQSMLYCLYDRFRIADTYRY